MLAIAGEHFIAADSGKQHSNGVTGFPADEIGRDNRGIGSWLIHMPDQLRQNIYYLRLHYDLVMIAVITSRVVRRYGRII